MRAALKFDPHNVLALLMLRQLTEDSVVMLGKEYFLYKVLPGDNLSKIAERFLGDKYLFYALARYNNISVPRQLQAGQIIKVPGKAPKNPAPIPAPPPPPQPPPPPPSSEACDKAFQFYQLSEQQRAAGKEILGTLDKAHEWYRECAKLASQSTEARTKLVQMKRPLADAYYREGLKGFHNQQLDLAIQLFQRSLEIDPKHPGAADYLRRAIVLREQCMRTGVCS